jgi:hypothetical protein
LFPGELGCSLVYVIGFVFPESLELWMRRFETRPRQRKRCGLPLATPSVLGQKCEKLSS